MTGRVDMLANSMSRIAIEREAMRERSVCPRCLEKTGQTGTVIRVLHDMTCAAGRVVTS